MYKSCKPGVTLISQIPNQTQLQESSDPLNTKSSTEANRPVLGFSSRTADLSTTAHNHKNIHSGSNGSDSWNGKHLWHILTVKKQVSSRTKYRKNGTGIFRSTAPAARKDLQFVSAENFISSPRPTSPSRENPFSTSGTREPRAGCRSPTASRRGAPPCPCRAPSGSRARRSW